MEKIIGRKEEQKTLQRIYDSHRAEFLAIYGRRRIGKTYLIKQFFSHKFCCYFSITGVKEGLLKEQLYEFTRAIEKTFYDPGTTLKEPKSWLKGLEILTNAIEKYSGKQKVILFFDELPWLASRRSRFLQALDYYWNTNWSNNPRIRLIVCGSAASWVIENIVNNKGGLHNRLAARIRLQAFTLNETRSFLKYRNIHLNEKQILLLYMVMGGIPHYLDQVERGFSSAQNIDKLCFEKDSMLSGEFNNLFSSLFNDAQSYVELIRLIANQRNGISRPSLLSSAKLSSGGRFNKRLIELEEAGFIISFKPYGHDKRGNYYRIIDEYILFYLYWIEPVADTILHQRNAKGYWEKKSTEASWKSWSGYAFEAVCYKHLYQIREALNISVTARIGAWRFSPKKGSKEKGAQIDLLFDRDDGAITLCEIKYTVDPFELNKQKADNLVNKMEVFKKYTQIDKQYFFALISANGVKPTIYSEALISSQTTLDDLFN